jgi:hypothetical protein
LRIQTFFSQFPLVHELQKALTKSDVSAFFPCKVQGAVSAQQADDLQALLKKTQADPAGASLLKAIRAHVEASDLQLELALDRESATKAGVKPGEHIACGVWYLDLERLQHDHKAAVRELAMLYEGMTKTQHGEYANIPQHRLPRPEDKLVKQWDKFVAHGNPNELRQEAVDRMRAWVNESRYYGGISHEQMLDLLARVERQDDIPQYEYELNLKGLNLDAIAGIPDDVRALDLSENLIRSMGKLPKSLNTLKMNANDVATGRAIFLFRKLPSSVRRLELDDNRIMVMMWTAPKDLEHFSISGNGLLAVPSVPPGLRVLQARDNEIRDLQHFRAPPAMTTLDLQNNRFEAWPPEIGNLGAECTVDLRRNRLTGTPPSGPRVICPTADDISEEPSIALNKLVAATKRWMDEPSPALQGQLRTISHDRNASAFVDFLNKLGTSKSAQLPDCRGNMADLITMIASPARAELRKTVFTICRTAAESCEDRAAICWTDLNVARLEDDIKRGLYDHRLQDLVLAGRQVFRLKVLTDIATAHVARTKPLDPLEVHLGYQVMLRDALQLSMVLPEMDFPPFSSLTPDILRQARITVNERESTEFRQFLYQDWEGWQHELKRNYSTEYEAAQQERYEMDATQYESALTQALESRLIPADDDNARAQLGVVVERELSGPILEKLTMAYLASRGLSDIPL